MQTPLCDVVIPAWNHPDLTRDCVQSLLEHTEIPARLIIVDNGSDPETIQILRSFKGNDRVALQILYNSTNEGFSKACNRGMRISDADYICLLNNDTLVTHGWLSEMIRIANTQQEIGIVNPASNTFGEPPNRILPEKEVIEMGSSIGFCLLIKRQVIEKIGYLDEGFEQAYYEDVDYCFRAKQAGFLCVLAQRAYVFHVGEASSPSKRPAYVERNRQRFLQKWGPAQRILYPIDLEKQWVESDQFPRTLFTLVQHTRNAHAFIDIHCYNPHGYTKEASFRQAGLIEHADIHFIEYNGARALFRWKVLQRALLKRKKPYRFYASSQSEIKQFLDSTHWLHRMKPLSLLNVS